MDKRGALEKALGKENLMIEESRYTKVNWPIFAGLVILMLVLLFYFSNAIAAADNDSKAVEVATKTINAMGGMEAWKAVPAVRFNFQVEREGNPPRSIKHLWDRKNARAHVEGKTREGKEMVAWIDLTKKTGVAWGDGKLLAGDELKKAMDWAYERWVNDTYWMIMPLKLLDRGVQLKYEGLKGPHDVVVVSFQQVGLTPGDRYWVYINQQTGLMDQWEYLLQGETEKGSWKWVDWQTFGGVKLSKLKQTQDQKTSIRFEPLKIVDSPDPGFFGKELKRLD